MSLRAKQVVIIVLGLAFLGSLLLVQYMEVLRKKQEGGDRATAHVVVPQSSQSCVKCHTEKTPNIVEHWRYSTHSQKGVGCLDCHKADRADADAFDHEGAVIATIVTPKDCSGCHPREFEEFTRSHHSAAGNILASLDNYLAETVEGHRGNFNPHGPTAGRGDITTVNGMASAASGCQQCHGAKVALKGKDGAKITLDDLKPDASGRPTNTAILATVQRTSEGKPIIHESTWPNTGIGRLNLDGSRGSCSACHSRHDFSPRRARQPENCGKCHMGPDHPQEEIYNESKHGIAYRDLVSRMNLDAKTWVLGQDYSAAPTCATCHMSGNVRNGGKVSHDPGERISWTNRPPISKLLDTDQNHRIVNEADPEKRKALTADSWGDKRRRMKDVCSHCHSPDYVSAFYTQYDELVILYNEKFGKPGQSIMDELYKQGLITKTQFDEPVEWTWFYLWHHEGRRARHGASMMAPDYTHWHGMFEVADRWYMHFIPEAREVVKKGRESGKVAQADAATAVIDKIMAKPEHSWFQGGMDAQYDEIRKQMEQRYGSK
jgi:hydroxylamine dehydrogenase